MARFPVHLLVGGCVAAIAVSQSATAQQAQQHHFDLAPQPLKYALRSVTRTEDLQLFAMWDDVEGRQSPALRGSYSIQQALDTLLQGTGLSAEISGSRVFIRGRVESSADKVERSPSEIVVTGSRIEGAPVASSVITITDQDMANAGQTNLADVVRSIPQNFGGGQNPGIGLNVPLSRGSYIGASTGLNLRGLGGDATLTLLNGQRLSYNATLQSIDISAIPAGMVDRIEIVADGASALYGSDAVAGVANVILKRDFDGILSTARLGASTDGGNEQQQYDLVGGRRWDGGGFIAAYDFERDTAIVARERSYAAEQSPGLTLYPSLKHHNAAISAHQDLAPGVSFAVDALYNKRWSYSAYALDGTGNVFNDGGDIRNRDESFVIAPSLKALLGSWNFALNGSYGSDRAHYASNSYYLNQNIYASAGCYCNTSGTVEFNANGPIFDLPAGAARIALGGGYRNNHYHGYSTLGTSQDIDSSQKEYYGYAEVELPLISPDQAIPAIYRLNVTGAVRYDDYPSVGHVATPKLGLIYAPTSDVDIKGSWGRSFKAPTFYQRYSAAATTLRTAASLGGTGYPNAATALLLTGGNPDLKPERATSWSATIDIHPRVLRGASLEVSYFNIHYRDRIVAPVTFIAQALSNPMYRDLVNFAPTEAEKAAATADPDAFVNGVGGVYNPANVVAIVYDNNLNALSQVIQGIDALARYRVTFGRGNQLTLTGNATYLHSVQRTSALQSDVTLAGYIFNPPHFRARLGAVWADRRFTLSSFLNYTGGVADSRSSPSVRVGSMTSWDVIARYELPQAHGLLKGLSFSLSGSNILNAKPSVITGQVYETPYDSTNYAPFGRVISLSVSKSW